jgi:DNA end-binding protein Ku
VMETLRYADELAKAQSYFSEIPADKPDAELLDLAESLIAKKAGDFDAGAFKDHYIDALKDLVARKLKAKGRKIVAEDEPHAPTGKGNVIDLMAALKKSLEKPGANRGKAAKPKTPAEKAAVKKRA